MTPINTLFAWPIAISLYGIMAIAATYDALIPSRPRRVDGFRATDEYARANGLETRSRAQDRAEWELAMGPDYWRGGRGRGRDL